MYTLLLDWEKAFDKVDQERMIIVLERMGTPEDRLPVSTKNHNLRNVKDSKQRSSTKRQQTGITARMHHPTYLSYFSPPS